METYLTTLRSLEVQTELIMKAADRQDWEAVASGLAQRASVMAELDRSDPTALRPAEQVQAGLILERIIRQDERLAALCREAFFRVRDEMIDMRDAQATVKAYRQSESAGQHAPRFVDRLN